VLIKRKAQKLRQEDRERIIGAVFGLGDEPRPRNSQRLQGRPGVSPLSGQYRAIYVVDDEERVVSVLQVRHRRDVYR
jgi:mRNA interferase RelE/StbE